MYIRWCLNNLRPHRHSCESRNLLKSGTEIPDQVRNDGMQVWGLFENFPFVGVVTNKHRIFKTVVGKNTNNGI